MKRKSLLWALALLLLVALLAAGCQSGTTPEPEPGTPEPGTPEPGTPEPDLKETIKIGFLAPLTGTFAANGVDMRDGLLLYLDQNDWVLGDHPVELFVEDTAGDPGVALTKARKLVESDGVDLLAGLQLANEGYAVAEYANENKITLLLPIAASVDLTMELVSDYVLRTGWSSSQSMHPFAEYVYNDLGYRRVVTMGMDYAFGYETIGGFQYVFEELGGEVVDKIWTPIGVPDFGPYLASIPDDIDAVVAQYVGGDTTRFIPAYEEYGLKGKIPLLGNGTLTDESTMQTMGDECLGIITAHHYSAAIDTPENREYVEAFRNRYGRSTSYFSEGPYAMAAILDELLATVDDFRDPAALAEAFRQVSAVAPRGPMTIDDYNNPVYNVYVREVQRVDGQLQNVVIHTYPEVSQFWKYDAQEFMSRPVYDRDYPPLKK